MGEPPISIFWMRRDLRLDDNTGLNFALGGGLPVLPLFIFDNNILDELEEDDPRVGFIHQTLGSINSALSVYGGSVLCLKGDPLDIWTELIAKYPIRHVYINRDYEPYAFTRDKQVEHILIRNDVELHSFKDQVIFERKEIVKDNGEPYTVFTPYKSKWLSRFDRDLIKPKKRPTNNFYLSHYKLPSLSDIGFRPSTIRVRPYDLSKLNAYADTRDVPSADSTTYLSPHLRFGTISPRQVIEQTGNTHQAFLNELIWREFFMQILFSFPSVVNHNFNRKYDGVEWRNDKADFERWCQGNTGYPLVDAGMRQLNATGYMHNRVRMVTAGFLCKHLLIDWRWGEAYFAQKLLDYDLSSNNGNWQWAAGTGCDAAPYFRIFNPTTQLDKFDKARKYVKNWVPEYGTNAYPHPVIDHSEARERALQTYKKGVSHRN